MKRALFVAITGLAITIAMAPLQAHHAFSAEFDANKPIVLKGKVSKVEWINPHSWIHLDVTGQDGKVVTWAIELGAPNSLLRRGINKTSIPSGIDLVIDAYLAKDGSSTANANNITLPDGKKFFAGSSGTGAPYESQDKK